MKIGENGNMTLTCANLGYTDLACTYTLHTVGSNEIMSIKLPNGLVIKGVLIFLFEQGKFQLNICEVPQDMAAAIAVDNEFISNAAPSPHDTDPSVQ